jgi:hypothetical protein
MQMISGPERALPTNRYGEPAYLSSQIAALAGRQSPTPGPSRRFGVGENRGPGGGDGTPGPERGTSARGGVLGLEGVPLVSAAPGSIRSLGMSRRLAEALQFFASFGPRPLACPN